MDQPLKICITSYYFLCLKVIDFNSLLDDYLNGLQSEEELHSANSAPIKIGDYNNNLFIF